MKIDDINIDGYYSLSSLTKVILIDGRRLDEALRNHPFAPENVDPAIVPNSRFNGKYYKGSDVLNFCSALNKSSFREVPREKIKIIQEVVNSTNKLGKLKKEIKDAKIQLESLRNEIPEVKMRTEEILSRFFCEYIRSSDYLLSSNQICGVYFLRLDNDVVYVGQSVNILLRIGQHQKDKEFDGVSYVTCNKKNLNAVEGFFIRLLRPKLNHDRNGNLHGPSTFVQKFEDITNLLEHVS